MLMSDAPTAAAPAVPATPGAPVVVPRLLEPRVAAHIERGRVAMRRLEEMFAKHPTLQSQEVKLRQRATSGVASIELDSHRLAKLTSNRKH